MATPTYTALATTTTSGGETSVTFGSIPQTYRDLILTINGTQSSANATYYVNGETATTNYSAVRMYGLGGGSGTSASYTSDQRLWYAATTQNLSIIQFMDYSATDKHKTVLSRSSAAAEIAQALVSRWANTDAITSITIDGMTFDAGNVISLYGIEA